MRYQPHIRPVPGAHTAVLFIHGIAGTPIHFRDLVPLVPPDWSVYNIQLDGHGKQVEDFSRTSMKKWKAQVARQLAEILETHDRVLMVGHSMGTLFSIQSAIRQPEQIPRLFLLNVPLRPITPPATAWAGFLVSQGWIRPGSRAEAMFSARGIHISRCLPKYLGWIPRGVELLMECRATRKLLPQLAVPSRCFQSKNDELVSRRAYRDLLGHPYIQATELQTSGHFVYSPEDTAILQTAFREFLQD